MPLEEKPWGLRAVAFVGGIVMFSVATSSLLLLAAIQQNWISRDDALKATAVVQGISLDVVGVLALILYLRLHKIPLDQAFGFTRGGVRTVLGYGTVLFLTALPIVMATSLIWRNVLQLFNIHPQDQDILALIRQAKSPAMRIYFFVLVGILAPAAEEGIFRGLFYPALKRHLGTPFALVIVSMLFGAIHTNLTVFVPLCVLGLVLGLAYEVTGNLLVAFVIHSLFNLTTLVVLLLFDA